jgi:predicted RNA-binding protein
VLVGLKMCEFTVILDGKEVFKDVVYAKMERDKIILRDVLGESLQFGNCKIIEVDVNSTRLVLSRL